VQTEGRLITSLQEQTGVVHVELDWSGRRLHAFGIWMGLEDEDTQTQIEEALAFIGDRTPASFAGDFNAQPGSPVYAAVALAGFLDPFPTLGIVPAPNTSPAVDPQERIDFVWLRGLQPAQAAVSESVASDHRLVVVEVDLMQPPPSAQTLPEDS
jgi:endonuclease/exonuclease/phosphatase (EEP) superfamily protein YafD